VTDHEAHPSPAVTIDPHRTVQEALDGGFQNLKYQGSLFESLQLAKVVALVPDPKDATKWSGRVQVQVLTMDATRSSVTLTIPYASMAGFLGGVPELESLLIIGWLPHGIPVALGYVMLGLRNMETVKGFPSLAPGEIYARASVREDEKQVGGGSVLLDRAGRVVLQSRGAEAEIVLGDDASDPSIKAKVTIRNSGGDGFTLSITDGGSVILKANDVLIDANSVAVGEETTALNDLVTRQWVRDVFDNHIHSGVTTGLGSSLKPVALTETGLTERLRSL